MDGWDVSKILLLHTYVKRSWVVETLLSSTSGRYLVAFEYVTRRVSSNGFFELKNLNLVDFFLRMLQQGSARKEKYDAWRLC